MARKKLSSPYYPNDIWIAWSTPNQRWFLLQGKSPSDSVILDRFETRAEAVSAAERLTSCSVRRDPSKPKYDYDAYRTVSQLRKRAQHYFDEATQGDRSLNQYKAFIYQGMSRSLEAAILADEGNRKLAKKVQDQAFEAFDLAADRADVLPVSYQRQAQRYLCKLEKERIE